MITMLATTAESWAEFSVWMASHFGPYWGIVAVVFGILILFVIWGIIAMTVLAGLINVFIRGFGGGR